MIPLSDENPTLRPPYMTVAILAAMFASWILLQGAGFDEIALATDLALRASDGWRSLVARQIEVDILEVVLARAPDRDQAVGLGGRQSGFGHVWA